MKKIWMAAIAAILLSAATSPAAPHLGMKLAAKRYGEAWNSGSRGALAGQVTGDFQHVFQRMPASMFAQLPRSGGGANVLSSSKGRGSGTVTVATSQGVLTFSLVGNGFNWRVADIYKRGDDGRTVSLKNYLDVAVTAHEFNHDLKLVGGRSFHDSITPTFRDAFLELSDEELVTLRGDMPAPAHAKPYISMNHSSATVIVQMAQQRTVTLKLVKSGGWRVDDYGVESPSMSIASFKNSLDTLAAVRRFREFMVEPKRHDPTLFTKEGLFQDSLVRVHQIGHLPMQQTPSPLKKLTVDASGKNVSIELHDRQVKLVMDRSGRGATVAKADVTLGKQWVDLGHALALNERARQTFQFLGMTQPAIQSVPATALVSPTLDDGKGASGLENASATEAEPPVKVASTPVTPAVQTRSVSAPASPVIRHVSYSSPQTIHRSAPVKHVRVKRGLFRRGR